MEVGLADAIVVVLAVETVVQLLCIRQFAVNVENLVRYLSNQLLVNQCIVANVLKPKEIQRVLVVVADFHKKALIDMIPLLEIASGVVPIREPVMK
jgi:hypothetical protein